MNHPPEIPARWQCLDTGLQNAYSDIIPDWAAVSTAPVDETFVGWLFVYYSAAGVAREQRWSTKHTYSDEVIRQHLVCAIHIAEQERQEQ